MIYRSLCIARHADGVLRGLSYASGSNIHEAQMFPSGAFGITHGMRITHT